jgi:hypothetical protein
MLQPEAWCTSEGDPAKQCYEAWHGMSGKQSTACVREKAVVKAVVQEVSTQGCSGECGQFHTVPTCRRLLLHVAKVWGVEPSQLLMVGDSLEDVEVGNAAGSASCLVAGGWQMAGGRCGMLSGRSAMQPGPRHAWWQVGGRWQVAGAACSVAGQQCSRVCVMPGGRWAVDARDRGCMVSVDDNDCTRPIQHLLVSCQQCPHPPPCPLVANPLGTVVHIHHHALYHTHPSFPYPCRRRQRGPRPCPSYTPARCTAHLHCLRPA